MLTNNQMALRVSELADAVDVITAEAARLRQSNRILRVVNRSLRDQLHIAHLSDELMRELCSPLPEDEEPEGGLPEDAPSTTTSREP